MKSKLFKYVSLNQEVSFIDLLSTMTPEEIRCDIISFLNKEMKLIKEEFIERFKVGSTEYIFCKNMKSSFPYYKKESYLISLLNLSDEMLINELNVIKFDELNNKVISSLVIHTNFLLSKFDLLIEKKGFIWK